MNVGANEPELRELMIRGLDGDAASYRTLLERLGDLLRAFFKVRLNRIGRGPVEAEDLLQETLIAIHTRRHTYDRSQLFTPWVFAIAHYKFLDYLRRTKLSAADIPIDQAEELMVREDTAQTESSMDLEKLLQEISPKERQAIRYVKLDGLSVREAAARSGMSESAVKVSVHRGLRALARLIGKEAGS